MSSASTQNTTPLAEHPATPAISRLGVTSMQRSLKSPLPASRFSPLVTCTGGIQDWFGISAGFGSSCITLYGLSGVELV